MTERKPVTAEELGALYRNHRTSLTATARQALRARGVPESVVSPEDIVQTAFTKALRDPAAIEHPVGYLRVVIRTEAANQARRCAEHRRLETLRTADPLRFDPACCPDFTTLVGNRRAVEQALAGLTLPQRTAVWTTKALDHTLAEAATLMDRAPGTVATHVSRGMVLLRAALAAAVVAAIGFMAAGGGLGGRLRRTDPAGQPGGGPGVSAGRWWRQGRAVLVAVYERSPGVVLLASLASLTGCAVVWWVCRPTPDGSSGARLRRLLDACGRARFWSRAMSRFVRSFTTRGTTSGVASEAGDLKGREQGSPRGERKGGQGERERGQAERPEPPDPRHAAPGANTRLQDLFGLAGWSKGELARLVNRQAAAMGRPQLSTDTSRVRRWIDSGEIPRDPVPRVLADLFTERLGRVVTVEDLGLVRHGRARGRTGSWSPADHPDGVPWAPERTAAVLTEFTGMDLMLNRRGLVGTGRPVSYAPDATREALKILEVVTHAPHGVVSRTQIARSLGRFGTIDESALSLLIRQGHLRQLPNNKYTVAGQDLSGLASGPGRWGTLHEQADLDLSANGVAPR